MMVTCESADAFVTNLQNALRSGSTVVGGTVWLDRNRRPLDGDKRHAVRWEVFVQAGCVVDLGVEGQFLLRYGELVGWDYEDNTKDFAGSRAADAVVEKIEKQCGMLGLRVLPGMVSE